MSPVWVQRQADRQAAYLAERTRWWFHRHHCHDPIGGPMPADIEDLLTKVMDIWHDAGKLQDEAGEAESHAANLRAQSEDKLDEADVLARQIIESRPEWRDALLFDHKDPRDA